MQSLALFLSYYTRLIIHMCCCFGLGRVTVVDVAVNSIYFTRSDCDIYLDVKGREKNTLNVYYFPEWSFQYEIQWYQHFLLIKMRTETRNCWGPLLGKTEKMRTVNIFKYFGSALSEHGIVKGERRPELFTGGLQVRRFSFHFK